jgi:hypothetical protein
VRSHESSPGWGGACVVVHSANIPLGAVFGITVITAAFSGVARLLVFEKPNLNDKQRRRLRSGGPGRFDFWNVFAIGPDLMVGAVVAIPALLAGRNVALGQSRGLRVDVNWNPNYLMVLMIFFLFCLGVSFERLFSKEARCDDGWKKPLFKGILPPALCGFAALGAALALGTS